jgi:galactitol-specific phosphotransferase system IIB component
MLRVLAACENGMGSSQMIKMKIAKVFKKLGVDVKIDHNSIGAAKNAASNYDAVFVSENFVSRLTMQLRRASLSWGSRICCPKRRSKKRSSLPIL